MNAIITLPDLLKGNDNDDCLLSFTSETTIRTWSRKQMREKATRLGNDLLHVLNMPTAASSSSYNFSTCMLNNAEFICSFFGVTGFGHAVAPLNSACSREEALESMKDIQSKALLMDATTVELSKNCIEAAKQLNVPVFLVDRQSLDLISPSYVKSFQNNSKDHSSAPAFFTCKPEDVALLLHTSGTTSKPKLVPLTHHNMCVSASNIRNGLFLNKTDVSFLVMPLFHIHGLVCGLLSALSAGGSVALPFAGKFSASTFWKDFHQSNATWYTAVPTMHQILLSRFKEDEKHFAACRARLRFARSCSSALSIPTLKELEKQYQVPIIEAYAMTEASHQMCSNPLYGVRKPGSVGRATNVQLAIIGEGDRILGPNMEGEICIRGENVTKGYLGISNENTFTRNGWFRTGDIGKIDEDGYLFIVGRLKEIINRGGEKISPNELDALFLTNPYVHECVCFGLPSKKYGEEVYVAIVLNGEGKQKQIDSSTHLLEFIRAKVSKEKIPTKIFYLDVMPKTASGKQSRKLVADMFQNKIYSSL